MVSAVECKMERGGRCSWKGMLGPGCEKIVYMLRSMDPCHHHLKLVILRNHMKSKVSLLNLFLFQSPGEGGPVGYSHAPTGDADLMSWLP